jgi:branched-chain amino acid transport system ATP-binding protein
MPTEALLEVRDLRAGYGETEVLRGVDLTMAPGEIVAVLGSNGVGKSTLNRALSGIVRARTGAINFEGHDVAHEKPQAIVARGLIHVPEGRRVFPNLSVRENLDLGSYRRGAARRAQNRERVFSIVPRLRERSSQDAGTLSGGEQQMLAMARGLATEPALLLLDELSMGLAPIVVEELYEIVAQIARDGVSILVVEQFARTVLGAADFAAIMVHGRIARVGRPDELEAELSTAYLGA